MDMEPSGQQGQHAPKAWDRQSLHELDHRIKVGNREAWMSRWGDHRRRREAQRRQAGSPAPASSLVAIALYPPAVIWLLLGLSVLVLRRLWRTIRKEGGWLE